MDFKGTSIGLEYEFPSLRIVKGGEPKTVLFSSSTMSDLRGVKLVLVTVDIAAGSDATTELITGPIVANVDNPKWEALQEYLYDMHKAISDCEEEGKLATTTRVVAKMEGRDDERQEAKVDELGDAVAAVAESVPPAGANSVVMNPCPVPSMGGGPPPPPPPPAPRMAATPRKKKIELPEEERPRFSPAPRWFSSTPQVNLGIQIATVGDSRFKTYGMLKTNFGGRISDVYPEICKNLEGYVSTLLVADATLRQKLELKGVLALNMLIAAILAAWRKASLDELDNKKVPYKESWGVLPKVKPARLWKAIDGDSIVTPKNLWRAVQRNEPTVVPGIGEAERMADTLLPGFDRREQLLPLLRQLGEKNAGGQPWKPAPGAPDPFTIHGCTASLWELRLSATDTRKATINRTESFANFGLFDDPAGARAYFNSCAELAEAQLSDEKLEALGSKQASPVLLSGMIAAPPPPPPPPGPPPPGPPVDRGRRGAPEA